MFTMAKNPILFFTFILLPISLVHGPYVETDEELQNQKAKNLEQTMTLVMEMFLKGGSSSMLRMSYELPLLWGHQYWVDKDQLLGRTPFPVMGIRNEWLTEKEIQKGSLGDRILGHLQRTRMRLSLDKTTKQWFEEQATNELAHLYAWTTGKRVDSADLTTAIKRINMVRRAMKKTRMGYVQDSSAKDAKQQQQQFSWSLLTIGLPTLVLVILANGFFVVFCLRKQRRRLKKWSFKEKLRKRWRKRRRSNSH